MNSSVLVNSGGFVAQSLRKLRGSRPGVVAALFTMLLFIAGCSDSSKTATPTPTFTPAAGTYAATQNVTVSDTDQSAVLYCTNDGSTPTASSPQCANPIRVSQSQTLRTIAIASGMNSSAIVSAAYTINASASAPTITGIGPATGSSAGGTSVTIAGTNFTGVTAVNFGTTQAASFTVNSSTSITAVSPAGSGSVHITVVAAGGTSATTTEDLFSYGAVPSITGLSPASATVGGAAFTLTVSGDNFTSDAVVQWNGATLTTTLVSSTQLTAAVPASLLAAAGTASVTVTESGGVSANMAFFINAAAPSIVGISPAQGLSAGGTAVNITGTNFTGVSAVRFGAASAASFTVNSANSITAVSPAGSAGTVDIQVVTPSGASATGVTDQFTYLAPPAVTGINPATGSSAGGTTVTITGLNLTGATAVNFGTTAARRQRRHGGHSGRHSQRSQHNRHQRSIHLSGSSSRDWHQSHNRKHRGRHDGGHQRLESYRSDGGQLRHRRSRWFYHQLREQHHRRFPSRQRGYGGHPGCHSGRHQPGQWRRSIHLCRSGSHDHRSQRLRW